MSIERVREYSKQKGLTEEYRNLKFRVQPYPLLLRLYIARKAV